MSESAEFTNYYLRQIGVVTPLHPEGAPPTAQAMMAAGEAVDLPGLDELARVASGCTDCPLSEGRTQLVFGVGNAGADIVFIGEAPGREEDIQGEPFVGKAGKLLDKMLVALGLDRSNVYIMNVVKCRPPGNRDPKPDEVAACSRWFEPQWRAIDPKIVVLLGRVAAHEVLETDASLAALRGRWHESRGVPVRVMYHPAYLLRSPGQKRRSWEDLLAVAEKHWNLSK
ncbi:MAG: uracil-DNA glycosylase [Mariprofundaceae bacterium]